MEEQAVAAKNVEGSAGFPSASPGFFDRLSQPKTQLPIK
jgi:hypothetical protein